MGTLTEPAHSRHRVKVHEDAGAVRRAVGRLAAAAGGVRRGEAEIVATELATNILRHAAGDGYLLCQAGGDWLELLAVDHGPGLPPGALPPAAGNAAPPRLKRDGGLGVGLAAVRRLASAFDAYSGAAGTVILARFGDPQRVWPGLARWGAVNVPLGGAGESGDSWAVAADSHLTALVVDGLGHGVQAAAASAAATSAVTGQPMVSPEYSLRRAHEAMRGTRGGVAGICVIDAAADELTYAGVGNIGGRVVRGGASTRLLSREGTLGTQLPAPRAHVSRLGWYPGTALIMASDGLRSRWDPLAYPGLLTRDPVVAAAVLYRDHERSTDDATVLVVQDVRHGDR